jgi:hypothetical protein
MSQNYKYLLVVVATLSFSLSIIGLSLPTIVTNSQTLAAPNLGFLNTNSNVGIVPGKPTNDPITKVWFVETINPGQTVEQVALVVNNSEQALPVIVMAKDATQTSEGGFSFKENQEADTQVGKWVEFLDKTNFIAQPKSVTEVKFRIKVPEGTKPGEYAGVIAVQQDKSGEARNGVQIQMRIGARLYITVPGELNMHTKPKTFEFLTDNNQEYKEFLQRNLLANYKDIYLNVSMENAGNIYTRISGKITLTDPEGKTFSTVYNKELAPNTATVNNRISVEQQQWKPGKYKAVLEWDNQPHVSLNKNSVKDLTTNKRIETEFEMTEEQLARMAKLQTEADADKITTAPKTNNQPTNTTEPNTEAVINQPQSDNTILYAIIAGLSVLVSAILGLLVYQNFKNSKTDNQVNSNSPDEATKDEK